MAFDVKAALEKGYTPDQIADYLGQTTGFDVKAARAKGYDDDQIVSYLSSLTAVESQTQPKPEKPTGLISGLVQSIGSGAATTGRSVAATGAGVVGANQTIEGLADSQNKAQVDQPAELKKIKQDLASEQKRLGPDAGFWESVRSVGSTLLSNPKGAAFMVAEQLPNAAATLGAGAAGAAALSPLGPIAAGAGFLGGMFLGNTSVEAGGKLIEKAEGGLTDAERVEGLKEGAIKGGVITAVDALTLKTGGALVKSLNGAAINAGARAEAKVLADAGVNVADKAAIETALRSSPELLDAAKKAGQEAAGAAMTIGQRVKAAGAGLTLESLGEGLGEFAGEFAATGKADIYNAVLESFTSLGQSSVETGYNLFKAQGNDLNAANIAAQQSRIRAEQALQGATNAGEAVAAANAIVGSSIDPGNMPGIIKSLQSATEDYVGAAGLNAPAPASVRPDITQAQANAQLEASALGAPRVDFEEEQRQGLISRTMQSVEARDGVASPEEAKTLRQANMLSRVDSVDPGLDRNFPNPDRSSQTYADFRTAQATGIELGGFAGVGFSNRPRPQDEPFVGPSNFQYTPELQGRGQTSAAPTAELQGANQASTQTAEQGAFQYTPDLQGQKNESPSGVRESRQAPAGAQPKMVTAPSGLIVPENLVGRAGEAPQPKAPDVVPAQADTMTRTESGVLVPTERQSNPQAALRVAEAIADTSGITVEGQRLNFVNPADLAPAGSQTQDSEGNPRQKLDRNTYRVLAQIARVFGKEIKVVDGPEGFADGFVDPKGSPRTIFLNKSSSINPVQVFFHELLHLLKNDNETAYEALANVIKERLSKEGEGKFKDYYNDPGVQGGEALLEELSADLFGMFMADGKFLRDVFMEVEAQVGVDKAKGVIERFAAAVMKAVDAVLSAIRQGGFASAAKAGFNEQQLLDIKAAVKQAAVDYAVQQRRSLASAQAGIGLAQSKVQLANDVAKPLQNKVLRYSSERGEEIKQSPANRGGVKEELGGFTVRNQKDGTLGVAGDPEKIKAALPPDVGGRVIPGGMVFTNSEAPRVKAALEGRGVAYSRAGQVIDKLPMRNGVYLGAPEKYNTPAKITSLRNQLRKLTVEGTRGRFWYENSSKAVLDMVGGNVQEARKFVALLAIYSPQAKVDANSTFALRAWAQYKAGQPISVKTAVMDNKANEAMADIDKFWSGQKTGNFFFNLLRMIDPSTADKQGATIDMWMMRAGEYSSDAPTSTQYAFMENEVNRIAKEMGWEPQQVQAAIWVAMKARMENDGVKKRTEKISEKKGWIRYDYPLKKGRPVKTRVVVDAQQHRDNWLKQALAHTPTKEDTEKAKFDFSDGVRRHIGQLSWEARPGRSTGVLPGIHSSDYEKQVEFQQAVQKALLDDNGIDLLAYKVGLLVDGPDILAPGIWQGDVAAGMQKRIAMPPAKGADGKTSIDPAQKQALEVYASVLGLLLRQEGVGYHRPFYKGRKSDENGVQVDIGRTFTQDEAQSLWAAIDSRMKQLGIPGWEKDAGLISAPSGMRVVNFGAIEDNETFRNLVDDAASTLAVAEVKSIYFSTDGDLITNNWKDNPNGESYKTRISSAGSPDLLRWAGTVLAPRIQSVFDEFSSKYGWGNPGTVYDASDLPAEDASGQDVKKSTQRAAQRVKEYAEEFRGSFFETPAIFETDIFKIAQQLGLSIERDDDIEPTAREVYKIQLPKVKLESGEVKQSFALVMRRVNKQTGRDEVQINVGDLESGMRGDQIYQLAGAYAFNNGLVFSYDEDGISPAGELRRVENLLMLGLKYGSFDWLDVHPQMIGKNGLQWDFNWGSDQKLEALLKSSNMATRKLVPEVRDVIFEETTAEFRSRSTGAVVSTNDFVGMANRARKNADPANKNGMPGDRTLRLTSIFNSIAARLPATISEPIRERMVRDPNGTALLRNLARNIRRSTARNPIGFYSALTKGVEGVSANAAPAAGWKDAMKGLVNKGLAKADEVEWSGVNDWLDLQTGKVTKEQVLDYLRNNGVQVEETVLGSMRYATAQLSLATDEELRQMYKEQFFDDGQELSREELLTYLEPDMDYMVEGGTKFESYTLPGGENYREVLLTLPQKARAKTLTEAFALWKEDARNGKRGRYTPDEIDGMDIDNVEEILRREYMAPQSEAQFRSSHWDQRNVLAHLRVNDRVDTDGNKVLFIEELQSDWGQKGREQGFRQKPVSASDIETKTLSLEEAKAMDALVIPMEYVQEYRGKNGIPLDAPVVAYRLRGGDSRWAVSWNGKSEQEVAADAAKDTDEFTEVGSENQRRGRGLATAPFVTKTDGWLNLLLKRAITMAVQGGYDKVAFTNGDQNANRYNQINQIGEVSYTPRGEGKPGLFEAYDNNRNQIFANQLLPGELPEYIGKEVAERLLAAEPVYGKQTLKGLDLKIGGEGMRKFYDQIVPQAINKLIKKFDSKVEAIDLNTERFKVGQNREGDWFFEDNAGGGESGFATQEQAQQAADSYNQAEDVKVGEQPGFAVTDKMREIVAKEGLPLFSRQRRLFTDVEPVVNEFGQLLAPNGRKSNLTEEQWYQVRSPEFKAWFGDWEKDPANASRVVDANGEPMVVYHGTGKGGFAVFNTPGGRRRGDIAIFATDNRDMADSYVRRGRASRDVTLPAKYTLEDFADRGFVAQRSEEGGWGFYEYGSGDQIAQADTLAELIDSDDAQNALAEMGGGSEYGVYPVFMNLRNALTVDAEGNLWSDVPEYGSTDNVGREAYAADMDGAIVDNVIDDGGGASDYDQSPSTIYMVFDPNNIKSANSNVGSFAPENPDIRYSPRRGAPPKKTVKAYKLFRVDPKRPGELFPLFVSMGENASIPIGTWQDAEEGAAAKASKTGKPQVKSKLGPLAYRPGFHAGDLPMATHIGGKSKKDLKKPDIRPANQVWAEIEMAADVDWQTEADKRGINKRGEFVAGNAHITDQMPVDGFYRYKTNPNMTGNWLIGGSLKINRVLSDKEVERINAKAGVSDLPREAPFNFEQFGFAKPKRSTERQTDTSEFKRWSNNAPLISSGFKTGVPFVAKVFHGTTNDISDGVFRPSGEGDTSGVFFSGSPDIASRVYAQSKAAYNRDVVIDKLRNSSDEEIKDMLTAGVGPRYRLDGLYDVSEQSDFDSRETWIEAIADALESEPEAFVDSYSVEDDLIAAYLKVSPRAYPAGANVVPAFIKMQNPMVINGAQDSFEVDQMSDWLRQARAEGHDGLVIADFDDGGFFRDGRLESAGRHDVFVAFTPDQIKSAIGNNGNFDPTNPDIRRSRQRQTDTPEFEQFFGDSTVVDGRGRPLVVYHSTYSDFNEFKIDFGPDSWKKFGAHFGSIEAATSRIDMKAGEDARDGERSGNAAPNVMPVYLSIQNPLRLPENRTGRWGVADIMSAIMDAADAGDVEVPASMVDAYFSDELKINGELWVEAEPAEQAAMLRKFLSRTLKVDGIVYRNEFEGGGDSYIVWDKTQIKSAIGNNGNFDPANPDIRRSRQRQTDTPQFKRWSEGLTYRGDLPAGGYGHRGVFKAYHQTDKSFDEFMPGGPADLETRSGKAIWLSTTPDADSAGFRTRNAQNDGFVEGANTMPLYVKMYKPLVIRSEAELDYFREQYGKDSFGWPFTLNDESIKAMKAAGYDAVINRLDLYKDDTPEIAVFDGKQLKSAIGNDGNFDPTNPDIRRSTQRSLTPAASKMDDVIYKLQDKNIDLKRVTQAILKDKGAIDDEVNAYQREELYHGRAAKQSQDFLNKELMPLLESMRQKKVALKDFETYLWNRHAEERNVQIAKVNDRFPDGGSGIKTADARAYLAKLDPAQRKTFEELAKRVDSITAMNMQMMVDTGLETQETVDAMRGAYKSYVPLLRGESSSYNGRGQGYSIKGATTKRALGSDKPVENILSALADQREKIISRAEKARVGRSLMGLALENPDENLWFVFDPLLNREEGQRDALRNQLESMGLDPDLAEEIALQPYEEYMGANGKVARRPNRKLMQVPNAVAVRINGEDKFIVLNQEDPRSARMAEALTNLDAPQLEGAISVLGKISRYFASINTQYNPVFGIVNALRDTEGAMLNLSSTKLAGKQVEVTKGVPAAIAAIYKTARATRKGETVTGEWATLYQRFLNQGGQTGYRDMFESPKDRTDRQIRAELNPTAFELAWKKSAGPVFDWLSDYNETMENAVRLSAFKVALENGMTDEQAASLAKNLTVNFNRKGQIGVQAGALYAFYNASTQGTARLVETMKGPAGKKIAIGGVLLGVAQTIALAMAGFDDEEPPEFVRERNLVIPTGNGKYATLPMPLGPHVLPNLGRIIAEQMMGRTDKSVASSMASLFGTVIDAFNPVGSGSLLQTMAPTVLDPAVALAENKDFTGKPIARADFNESKPTPGYTRARDNSMPTLTAVSKTLNWLSGGSDYTKGVVSPTPDQLEYLIGQVTGGVGRELSKINQVQETVRTGEELPSYKVPLAGRFFGDTREQSSAGGQFYANLRSMNDHKLEIEGRAKNREDVAGYLRENPDARLFKAAERVEQKVQDLRKLKRQLIERDGSPERVRQIDDAITRVMRRFNDQVRAAKGRELVN